MLEELRLSGLGVIDEAVLPLGPGFTVVTGETGAGKTMVVTGLALLHGGRADAGAVRVGAGQAAVEGRVLVDPAGPAGRRAVEAGAVLDDDGGLQLCRTVAAEGRSRAYAGGRAVPVAVLAELAEHLVAVHGQSDQQRLLRPAAQRDALDRYAGTELADVLAAYRAGHARHGEVLAELADVTAHRRERVRELDLLQRGLAEIEEVAPVAGEDAALAAEAGRLAHADGLARAARTALLALAGDDSTVGEPDAAALLSGARRALEVERGHDQALDALADRVAELGYLVTDVAGELASYAAGVDADPARLAQLQDRQAAIGALLRKYGEDVVAVLGWAAEAGRRVAELDGDDDRLDRLAAERDELRERLAGLAGQLSARRAAAAGRFAAAVSAELAELAMPHARVEVAVRQHEDPDGLAVDGRRLRFGPDGVDEVELLLTPHPGAPPRPLARGASGGELSRVMLAVEVVFAGAAPVPMFVFDEVDAGVGGRAAVEVGRRLARLAAGAQVLVVTHLPQVAAFADRHLVVHKDPSGAVTSSGVRLVDGEDRLRELTRMLSGLEDSELGRDHAAELLEVAAAAKAAAGTG